MLFLTEESEYTASSSPQVLYFYASRMPFHRKFALILGKMAEKYKNIAFFAIDVDYFKVLCRRFEVVSIPTVIIILDGKEEKRLHGLISADLLERSFADICTVESH